MSFEEMVVALVASIGGIALVGFVFAKITGLIRAWINRSNSTVSEEDFDRLARAFIEHKKDTQRRLHHLEAVIADEEQEQRSIESSRDAKEIESPRQDIEIDDAENKQQESPSGNDSNLRNMLRE